MILGRPQLCLVAAVGVAATLAGAVPKTYYQLERQSQELTEALAAGRSDEVYQMFVPTFQDEIRFSRFDSAFSAWHRNRRIKHARSRVVDIRGLGGHVSTRVVFDKQSGYSYVYQSWLYTRDGWELMWLSNIMNQTFQYGRTDTAELDEISEAALGYLTSEHGLKRISRKLSLPQVVVAVHRGRKGSKLTQVRGRTVCWLTQEEAKDGISTLGVPFYFEFALVRGLGEFALATVDLRPTSKNRTGPVKRSRGIQLYLERESAELEQTSHWKVHSIGKIW